MNHSDNTNNEKLDLAQSNTATLTTEGKHHSDSNDANLPRKTTVLDSSLDNSLDSPNDSTPGNRNLVGKLELLEERAVVNKERLDIGKINVTKKVRTKTVNVPIELAEEVLVIETEYFDPDSKEFLNRYVGTNDIVRLIEPTLNNKATIKVNGSDISLEDGPIELVISRQVAVIQKETCAVQDIAIEKSTHIHKDNFNVELRHEELDVQEEGFLDHQNLKR